MTARAAARPDDKQPNLLRALPEYAITVATVALIAALALSWLGPRVRAPLVAVTAALQR